MLIALMAGSPPRMRGKVLSHASSLAQHPDHPRVCGEKRIWPESKAGRLGSPPRMRGKGLCREWHCLWAGITPAYAGKRKRSRLQRSSIGDHPRVCGEKFRAYCKIWNEWGSPPRMRGKEISHQRLNSGVGITPAYAGKRLKRSRSTVPPVAIVPLFPSVCNKPVASDGSPAGRDAPLFLPAENAVPASPAYNLRSL